MFIYGKNYILEMNQRNEIYNFISIVKDYVNEIPEMRYKVDLEKSMLDKYQKILEREEGRRKVLTSNFQVNSKEYSNEEVDKIIQMRKLNYSISKIADEIGRTYWEVYDKIRRMQI